MFYPLLIKSIVVFLDTHNITVNHFYNREVKYLLIELVREFIAGGFKQISEADHIFSSSLICHGNG